VGTCVVLVVEAVVVVLAAVVEVVGAAVVVVWAPAGLALNAIGNPKAPTVANTPSTRPLAFTAPYRPVYIHI
jgi:hypothetical protein